MERSTYLRALAAIHNQALTATVDLPLPLSRSPAWSARDIFEVALAALTPHVSRQDMNKLVALSRSSLMPAPFAVPALMMHDCYHLLEFRPSDGLHPECLRYRECVHLPKSPARSGANVVLVPQWQPKHPYLFVDEALRYSRKHWMGDLHDAVNTDSFVTVDLISSPGSSPTARVSSTMMLFLELHVDFRSLLSHDSDEVERLLDSSLRRVTAEPVEGEELKGGRGSNYVACCGRCGGRLSQTECLDCGVQFRSMPFRPQTIRLSQTLRSFAEAFGHKFEPFLNGSGHSEAC